jgi:uncharacterized protein YkwD
MILIVLVLCSQTTWAADPKDENPSPARQVVNKPVVEESGAKLVSETHLHEHPILIRMLHRNNELRNRVGLRPHRINPILTKAAQDHANYMAATGSMDHYSNAGPQGRANRWGFRSGVLENIAMGQPTVESVFSTWQNSGGHWASITSNTTDAGFGCQKTANGAYYWCAVYGTDKGETVTVSGEAGM